MSRPAKVCLQLLAVLGAILGVGGARAADYYSRTIECSTCVTPYDFKQAAVTDNLSLEMDATYMVVGSSTNQKSAFVRVTGNWWPYGGGQIWYPTGTPVTEDGYAISTNSATASAQLSAIDVAIFGFTRTAQAPNLTSVRMPTNYSESFINGAEEFDSPGIGYALIQLGRNPSQFPIGYKLTVLYDDGSKAIFVKISNTGSYQWA